MKEQRLIVISAAILPIILSGCHVQSYTVAGSESINTDTGVSTVTVSGSITIVPHAVIGNVDRSDLPSIASSGVVFSSSQDAQNFSPDSSGTPTATLIATTDTGYQTTVTVQLQPVSSAIDPVNAGDAVYSYAIVGSPEIDNWAQAASQNAQSSVSVSAVGSLPFVSQQIPGTYTVAGQTTSQVTDPSPVSTASYSVADSGDGCNGRPHCYVVPGN